VIESGQVAETGTHEELLEAGGLYADLYLTQFKSQENQERYTERLQGYL
jgi:ABC-type transport system involved in cytochrome bd biosynthesis fused ATPase/permease subunit